MADLVGNLIWQSCLYSFGLFNYLFFIGLAVCSGAFFRKTTKREGNDFLLARNKYWNLSNLACGLHHRFFVLRNSLRLHYLTNVATPDRQSGQGNSVVILIHGFPDSSLLWRYATESSILHQNSTLVAVDLPGYGGSDSFFRYGASEILEALTEFIVAMREQYLIVKNAENEKTVRQGNKVFIVGHDWGCVLAYRLAAEAPCLADRFILTNGPYPPLALANKDRILTSSKKMLMTFFHAPITNYHCLPKAVRTVRPLAYQILLFGYIAALQLPDAMVRFLGVCGDYWFIRGAHRVQYGKDKADYDPQDSLVISMGPGPAECQPVTSDNKLERYGESVLARATEPGSWFLNSNAYYRDGVAFHKWEKSIQTLASLYDIEIANPGSFTSDNRFRKRRTSSASSTLLSGSRADSLKAPATIIWGKNDPACFGPICLDGLGDYLTPDSQVLILPDTGHWTPLEKRSRETLKKIFECLVQNGDLEKKDLQEISGKTYPNAMVSINK